MRARPSGKTWRGFRRAGRSEGTMAVSRLDWIRASHTKLGSGVAAQASRSATDGECILSIHPVASDVLFSPYLTPYIVNHRGGNPRPIQCRPAHRAPSAGTQSHIRSRHARTPSISHLRHPARNGAHLRSPVSRAEFSPALRWPMTRDAADVLRPRAGLVATCGSLGTRRRRYLRRWACRTPWWTVGPSQLDSRGAVNFWCLRLPKRRRVD
ncbi:hypothetical protein C8Q77DRAFT_687025 [Trametes polyzona]|nr:hypothetical protein C8Q77DRAFT_687025 [Trametes polyzona]